MTGVRARRTIRTTSGQVVLAGVLAASMIGVAQAYLLASGTGSGTASTLTPADVSLSPASPADTLYPGDTAEVALTATNPSAVDVRIGSLVLDATQGTNGYGRTSGSASCTLTTFTFTTQDNGGDGWVVPANGTVRIALPDALAASPATVNACQNAVLAVYLKAVA